MVGKKFMTLERRLKHIICNFKEIVWFQLCIEQDIITGV